MMQGKKVKAGMRVLDPRSTDSFDPTETVILDIDHEFEMEHKAQLVLSLLIKNKDLPAPRPKIFSEAAVVCHSKSMLTVGQVIDFNFLEVEKDIVEDKEAARIFKSIRTSHKEVLSTKKYKIIGHCLPDILFIRPLQPLPPSPKIFYGNKKSK
jgi:hypothetical protein